MLLGSPKAAVKDPKAAYESSLATAPEAGPVAQWCPVFSFFSPTAESFGVSAQIGSGVVRGGPEVRFHEGSTRVPRGFHEVLRDAVGDIT